MEEEEKEKFIFNLRKCYSLYFKYGSSSGKKVDKFHRYIKAQLETIISNRGLNQKYSIMLEQKIPSINSSGEKKCDIVMYKHGSPYIIFPVKLVMTNYNQNKNNSWENLTGECMHLYWKNENLKIIPINVFMSNMPYRNKEKKIKKFEKMEYKYIENYEYLKQKNIVYDLINYIVLVEHDCDVGDVYDSCPNLIGFHDKTPYRDLSKILNELIV